MSVMNVNQGADGEGPAKATENGQGKEREGRALQLSERGAGWIIFGVTAVLLAGTITSFMLLHTRKGRWVDPGSGVWDRPPMQWVDWLIVGMMGACLYVLVSIAYWLIQRRPRFKKFTAWYIATLVKSPIMALIILIFLTGVNVEVSGLTVDFTKMEGPILLVIAFVLGFYGSVAREQLNLIVKGLFPKAYGIAEGEFNIVPGRAEVVFGKSVQLKTSPLTEVTWQAPSAGKIEDGLYTAPAASESQSGQVVQITAVPKDPNIPRAFARITLVPFKLSGKTQIKYKGSEQYQVVREPSGGVTWSASPELTNATITVQGIYAAPSKIVAEQAGAEGATITATSKDKADDVATIYVRFVEES